MIKTYVLRIDDEETLDIVSDVCEIDHPSIADAATARADTISMANTARLDVSDWTTTVDTESYNGWGGLDVESLTITELKHIVRSGMNRSNAAAGDIASRRNGMYRPNSILRHSALFPRFSTISTPPDIATVPSLSEIEGVIKDYETALEDMAKALRDHDFRDELGVISHWFRVLSDDERGATIYALTKETTQMQQRFFTLFLNQMSKLAVKDIASVHLTAALSKAVTGNKINLDLSTVSEMFPDAVAAIAQRKEEYAELANQI